MTRIALAHTMLGLVLGLAFLAHSDEGESSFNDPVEVVLLARDETGDAVEHAQGVVVTPAGITTTSKKSGLLTARIPRELFAEGGGALLVCAEGYYCGGFLAGDYALKSIEKNESAHISVTLAARRLH